MIQVHLSVNNKPALIDEGNILFAEECDGKDEKDRPILFTRIFVKQAIPGDPENRWLDVRESVDRIMKLMR